MCMGLNSLTLDLPVMTSLDLSMLGIKNLTLNCNKLIYANLRGSYKLESSVRFGCGILLLQLLRLLLSLCVWLWLWLWLRLCLWSGLSPLLTRLVANRPHAYPFVVSELLLLEYRCVFGLQSALAACAANRYAILGKFINRHWACVVRYHIHMCDGAFAIATL